MRSQLQHGSPVAILGAAVIALALAGPTARANGQFPQTKSIALRAGNASDLYVGTTFGLLLSHDDGAHFDWICEQTLGYSGTWEPKYRVASDGTIYGTTFEGLRVSRDGGCTFTTATENQAVTDPGRFAGKWVEALDVGADDSVWVATAEGGMPNDVYRSVDKGQTFRSSGLVSSTIWWKSVVVARSNPQRVYVTGYQVTQLADDGGATTPEVHVMRTDDGGDHWLKLPVTDFALAPGPLLLLDAVSPTNPDVVFARSVNASPPSGDRLYRSLDGGLRWQAVLDTTAPIRGVLFRSGGAQAGTVIAGTITGGVFASTDGGATFLPASSSLQMACVGERADGAVFGCGANWDPDNAALARATDAGSWTKVMRFIDITGPLACAPGTVQYDTCASKLWPALKEQFGIKDPDGGPVDAAPADASGHPGGGDAGCCDAGADRAQPAGLALLVGFGLRRRRAARH